LQITPAIAPCGRYLAAKSEADHYQREMKREQEEIIAVPDTGKPISRYNKIPYAETCR
jgi:hypothetical protein